MAKEDFRKLGEKEEVIPAVERVKKQYLDARDTMIKCFNKVAYRRKYGLSYSKEMVLLEASVISLYLELRDKFEDSDSIRALDTAITSKERMSLEDCYEHGKTLLKKLEDLKLTKIEFKRGDPTRSIF